MLHLARIKKKALLGKAELQLLARQKADSIWEVLTADPGGVLTDVGPLNEGALVLADLTPEHQVITVEDATPWVLEMVQQYLTLGMHPAQLQQEIERAEQWRQSLTLQSQEFGRRVLETEARRDEMQELEENLKREKEELKALEDRLKVACPQLVDAFDMGLERADPDPDSDPDLD